MKRINNSDIRIRVDKEVLPEKFRFRFYTTDTETYIERTQEDAIVSGDTIFIDLAWQYLQLLSTGIMCYELQRSYPDPRFPDGYYDTVATYSSDYYIESEAQPIPPAESATTLEIVIQLIEDMEELYSTQLSGETSAREALEDELHGNYYTSGQTEQYVQDAIDNLNIGSYYTSAQTQEYVGEQVGTERAAREALADELHGNYYTSGQTEEYVNNVIEGKIDLSNYYTSAQTQEYVTEQVGTERAAREALADELHEDYYTSAQTQEYVNDVIEGKIDLSNYYTSAQTQEYVSEQISGITVDAYTKAETDAKISEATEGMATQEWVGEQGYLTEETEPAFNASPASGITSEDITSWDNKSDFSGDYNDLQNKPTIPDVSDLFNDAQYDSQTKRINFYHGNTILCYIDAAAFVKDGMVDNVVIDNGYIKITFNTDAGKQEIDIPISDIFNAANYWTSGQTAQAIATASGATVTWVENQHYLTEHQSLANYYTSGQTNAAISAATNDMATQTWVGQQGYLTEEEEPDFNASAAKDITSQDISNWNAKSDFSGDYNDLQNKPDLTVYYTSGQTNSAISAATNDMATKTWVGQQGYLTTETEPDFNSSAAKDISSSDISNWNNKSDFSGDYNDLINKPDLSVYYTSAQTNEIVSTATQDMATQTWVGSQNYTTSGATATYVQGYLNNHKIVTISQSDYDNLQQKDPDTLYFITTT